MPELEIYDTTLREGEQASGASFSQEERIKICKELDEFGVDFIELGWPVSSQEIFDSFKKCKSIVKKAKIVAFGSTSIQQNISEDKNLKTLAECGAEYVCIFGKSSLSHVEKQLKISAQENLKKISESIEFLKNKGIHVFYDAEHYFDGFKLNNNYALETILTALKSGAERVILCDTNGGTLPEEASEIAKETKNILEKKGFENVLGIHFHDDCGLALANTLSCLKYAKQVQGTINGIGERVGNLNFSEFLPNYILKMKNKKNLNLKKLKEINEEVFRAAGICIPESRAFVGESAFAHKGGVHVDAMNKGASYEHLSPEEVGNKRVILLNTLGGRGSVISAAKEFGYSLDKKDELTQEKINKLFEELNSMEKKGYRIGAVKAEQFLLIEKYFGKLKEILNVKKWEIKTSMNNGVEESEFDAECFIEGKIEKTKFKVAGGPVDACYKTLKEILKRKYPEVEKLKISDFHVEIARRKQEESSVRTLITFEDGEEFETIGVDKNILQSAVEAIEKGFRYYLNRKYKN